MQYITGTPRQQLTLMPEAIEDYIPENSPVRFLDAYVESLDMQAYGFNHSELNYTGRPPYNPKDLLKLYLYGYLNRIRSSRLLERETHRNLEVLWLITRLAPDHWVINKFRQENGKALRLVFKHFIKLCKQLELFSAEFIAIDSTKFKASNARDRIKTEQQLAKNIERLQESVNQYLEQLDQNDTEDNASNPSSSGTLTKDQLQKKIASLAKEQQRLEKAREELKTTDSKHISLTDPDCRLMKRQGKIEPAYSVHTAVDSKHKLIVDYEVTQDAADNNYLSSLALKAKENLGVETITASADAGYYDTIDLKTCEGDGITTFVPIPKHKVSKKTNVPRPEYYPDQFAYDHQSDTYRCPQGQIMEYYHTTKKKKDGRRIRVYRTGACAGCPVKAHCTTSPRGRYIHRWEDEAVLDRLKQRLSAEPGMTRKRKTIVEHPFGTIKGVWGYGTFLLRSKPKVSIEASLLFFTYNLRRVLNIVGTAGLIAALRTSS